MAVRAADPGERLASLLGGRRRRRGSGRGQHPHEVGKSFDVGDHGRVRNAAGRGSGREVERVIRSGDEETARRFVALLREKLVRDAHLDVVGLAREHEQGFVLRLPSETSDGPIVRTEVHVAAEVCVGVPGDTQRPFLGCVGLHVRQDGRVGNRFDEPRAKDRSWDAENNVRIPTLAGQRISRRQEIELGDVAAGGVSSPGDHEEVVHFAVGGAVALLKPRFADGTILHDEPGHRVLRSAQVGNCQQGILRRTRAAASRLRVAGKTLVGVEARTEAVVRALLHDLNFSKPRLSIVKEQQFRPR